MTKRPTSKKKAAGKRETAAVVASNSAVAFKPWSIAPATEAKATRAGS